MATIWTLKLYHIKIGDHSLLFEGIRARIKTINLSTSILIQLRVAKPKQILDQIVVHKNLCFKKKELLPTREQKIES